MTTPDRRLGAYLATLLLALGGLALPAASADKPLRKDYALIFGTVWSSQQRPVYGVKVKIRRANEKRTRWELVSDHKGEFAQRVPAGQADYVVWADIKTRKDQPRPEVTVHVEYDERVNIGLHLTE